jgi:hypothetical protein
MGRDNANATPDWGVLRIGGHTLLWI